ncbi:MAG: T9SS type A sorting domain-containing protein [Flavobacteriales bacterium]
MPVEGSILEFDPSNQWDFDGYDTNQGGSFGGGTFIASNTTVWQQINVSFVCPDEMDGANILGMVPNGNNAGQILIDAISLFEISPDQPEFEMPNEPLLCDVTTIQNLQNYITLPNGWGDITSITGPSNCIQNPSAGVYHFDATVLPTGTYDLTGVTISITVETPWGCPYTFTHLIESCCQLEVIENYGPNLCNGNTNIELSIDVQGAYGNYSIFWDGPGNTWGQTVEYFESVQQFVTYTVTVTDLGFPNCSVVESYAIPIYDIELAPDYSIGPLDDDWIDEDYYLMEDLIVETDEYFEINNCVLHFAPGKGIILQNGADLKVRNNSLLTNVGDCPDGLWRGIYAEQFSNHALTSHSSIRIIENSRIELAEKGIQVKTLYSSNPAATNWVNVICQNAEFTANRQDINMLGQTPGTQFYASFTNCSFELGDPLMQEEAIGLNPTHRVLLQRNDKFTAFINCSFHNYRQSYLQETAISAIRCLHAHVDFGTYTPNNTVGIESSSQITGYARGIDFLTATKHTCRVSNTDMANWRNIYVMAGANCSFKNNDLFCLPEEILLNLSSPILIPSPTAGYTSYDPLEPSLAGAPYGLYVDKGTSYTAIDNYFNMAIATDPDMKPYLHGLIANNTGDFANRIRRNHFADMGKAIKLQGDNRLGNGQSGTKYSCNEFTNNDLDIRELSSTFTAPSSWGVAHQQSVIDGDNSDPSNFFDQSICDYCDVNDISNTTGNGHNYVRAVGSSDPETSAVSDPPAVVIVQSFQTPDDCISSTQNIIDDGGNMSICSNEKENAETQYIAAKTAYDTWIDGGSTEDVLQVVNSTTFSSALETFYYLIERSPNLSEEALRSAIEQYNLPTPLLVQILASNPRAAKSTWVQQELLTLPIALEEYQLEQIAMGLNIWTSTENMESLMSGIQTNREAAMRCIWEAIENDSTITDKLSAQMALLDETTYYTDLLHKINFYVAQGNYADARQLTLDADDYHQLSTQDEFDMSRLYLVLEMEEELSQMNSPTLTTQQITALEEKLTQTSAFVAGKALDLLIAYAGKPYIEPIVEETPEERSMLANKKPKTTSGLRIYPNPADDLVVVDYPLAGINAIQVYNSIGQLAYSQNVSMQAKQFALDLSQLPGGVYELKLCSEQQTTVTTSLVLK